ncbi:hypothetical protein [Bacillus thuringiensis]|uniref:DUF4376 domain-containing protein n=1 Tax=Bacillus thuringiensis TaxID=1428 RepID=UPI000A392057|nr:hypothetical protein [Bacillus thuringiensis]OTZ58492.1 hypothetical protein BK762_00530 [Bacillus thuringiensis serovar toumanoffi]
MIFNKPYEEHLLQDGYDALSYEHKNMLVLDLANNFGVTFNEVTMDMILTVHKTLKLAETEEIHQMEIEAGFVHPETLRMYDITIKKQVDMIGIRVLLQTTDKKSVDIRTEDSGVVTHTRDEFIDLFEKVISYKDALDTKLIRLNEAIMTAKTTKDLLALDWYSFDPNATIEGGIRIAGEPDSSTGQVLPDGTGSEGTGTN